MPTGIADSGPTDDPTQDDNEVIGSGIGGTQDGIESGGANTSLLGGSTAGWSGYGQPGGLIASGSNGGFSANPNIYANNLNTDNAAAQGYYNEGQAFNQAAPTAFNPDQAASQGQMASTFAGQGSLESQLQGVIANPSTSQASQQYASGVQQAAAGTTALGNSSGSGPAAAGARRDAQQTNAVAGAAAVSGQQQVNAAAQAQAQSDLSGVLGQQGGLANSQYSLENQNAQANAEIAANQGKLNDSAMAAFSGLSSNAQGMAVNDLTGYSNDLLGQAGASSSEQQANNNFGNAITSAALGAVSGLAGGASAAYTPAAAPDVPSNAIGGIGSPDGSGGQGSTGNTSDFVSTGDTSDSDDDTSDDE